MSNDWTEHTIRQWQTESIDLNPGISLDKIMNAEKTLDFVFPEQFKELYLKVNGFRDSEWRTNMFSIWSLHRVLEEYKSSKDKNFIAFSDYLINSHQIGFTKDKKGVFKYFIEPKHITDTFAEAIQLINSDSELIYL